MNFWEITIMGELVGQQIINRLTFISDPAEGDMAGNSLDLLDKLGYIDEGSSPTANSVLDRLLEAQTDNYWMTEIVARNLYNVVDFYVMPLATTEFTGTITAGGDTLPTFVASRLQTNRVRTDVRRGSLQLTGGTEEMVEGLNAWNSTYQTALQNAASALNALNSVAGAPGQAPYRCAVLSKEPYTIEHGGGKPDTTAYRYYASAFVQQGHTAVGVTWSAVPTVTSQITRKIGRGS